MDEAGRARAPMLDVTALGDQLAMSVAHDLNNLLAVIRANLDVAIASLPAEADVHTELVDAHGAARRAAELLRRVLAFGRKQPAEPRAVDVNRLATTVRDLLRHVLGPRIARELALAPSVWPVLGDVHQLEQVLMNLAVNARDAMPDGGRFVISTANVIIREPCADQPGMRAGEYVLVTVEDTGHGIDPAVLPRVFERFFTTKEPGHGTGLGLSIVHGIVTRMGGSIYADSPPSGGARFRIYLPRYAGTQPETARDE